MATPTTDYDAVARYLDGARLRECLAAPAGAPGWLAETVPYIRLDVLAGPGTPLASVLADPACQVLTSGWGEIEGVLAYAPEPEFDADLRVVVAADHERALRDLLLAVPPGALCYCYVAGDWALPTVAELLDGAPAAAREGHYADEAPPEAGRARRLGADDYALVAGHWSEAVWREVIELGYAVFAATDTDGSELGALCFHWPVGEGRSEVHGLQAVRAPTGGAAGDVFRAATADVVRQGRVATCTAVLSDDDVYARALAAAGYRRYYRVPSFLGARRGTRALTAPDTSAFLRTPRGVPRQLAAPALGEGRELSKGRDPLVARIRDLGAAAGRREQGACVAEGVTLVRRAIEDRLTVRALVYTAELLRSPDGVALLRLARERGVDHYRASEGLVGTLTPTRPTPAVLALVEVAVRDAATLRPSAGAALLVAEDIQSPDNLGMLLRSADAAGAEAVVVAGGPADPLHRSCVRAARGAVGRLPIFSCADLPGWLDGLARGGVAVLGATTHRAEPLYEVPLRPPLGLLVGNETSGLSAAALGRCTARVAIPMAPGQDSLNVGVAAGVLLYEVVRQRMAARTAPG